jgi:hypothetical protein
MMRLGKKKEEAKQEAKSDPMEVTKSEGDNTNTESHEAGEAGAVSVLGIGGKRIQGNTAKKPTKKRTPGEIRIQKG